MGIQFRSLRARILVLGTLPLAVLLGVSLIISHRTTTRSIESAASGRLNDAASVVDELVRSRHTALRAQTRVTAADPRFFATFSVPDDERGEEFELTMAQLSAEFLRITDADFVEIYDAGGAPVLRVDRDGSEPMDWRSRQAGRASVARAVERRVSSDRFVDGEAAVLVVDAPVFLGHRLEAVLRMGRELDQDWAHEVRRLTGAELALGRAGNAVLSTWTGAHPEFIDPEPPATDDPLAQPDRQQVDGETFLCVQLDVAGLDAESGFSVVLGRSTGAELADLRRAERLIVAIGLAALAITIVAGFSIAFGVTRPLHHLVRFAKRIREGDYSQPVPVEGRDEIAQLAGALEESRQALHAHVHRLEELDKRRGEFLALAGHELRTPLTVITSFNGMLQDGALGELPAEVAETTGLIGDQLAQLNDVVTDILDLTALETAPEKAISVQQVSLQQTVLHVIGTQKEARGGRDVELRWDLPEQDVAVDGDERLLARAFRSLLDNAIRFTPDGGRVQVGLVEREGIAQVSVADNGVGISPDDMRWVCDKFYEVGDIEHHSSGGLEFRAGGLGIGLSIVRAVLNAHGGRLEVESHPGSGSTFTMTLPVSRVPTTPELPLGPVVSVQEESRC